MSNYQKIDTDLVGLGPMAGLIGIWDGNSGTDVSPGFPDRMITETEKRYREQWMLELISPAAENHDQKLRQLSFATNA